MLIKVIYCLLVTKKRVVLYSYTSYLLLVLYLVRVEGKIYSHNLISLIIIKFNALSTYGERFYL